MRGLIVALLLAVTLPAQAMRAIFYQPQLRDQSVAAAQWPGLFSALHRQGFDTVVWQWTRYGQAFATGTERDWLLARMREAHAAGLALIVGLAADPDFFQQQQRRDADLPDYLQILQRNDAAQARGLLSALGPEIIQGWYLAAEVDDMNWRETARQQALVDYLRAIRADLSALSPLPVYISTFFNGHAAPDAYGQLIDAMTASGVYIWLQDGAGTSQLSPVERERYLSPLANCHSPHVAGVIHELFINQGTGGAFAPRRPNADEAAARLRPPACHALDQLWFSLRYLPGIGEPLPQ
ncbi:DUF4434 domain-containing protein [Paludibacterium purpuratum]|uniref:Uncharacterized protein DUF4434 n=1 Tax=Paludibacterium purpuratum TaxID=1144873 RepID=A0A4R7BCV9_9NEIS|nr:DUF4434 domain-containing protein [Paludibacterium purpuratum]TDR82788.1 uncharacterized protein DUF4434 [Paludibacterium purpuratum]